MKKEVKSGKTLIDLGYKPAKWFKNAIDHINKNNLEGDALKDYVDSCIPTYIEPFKDPVPYYKNLEAITQEEKENYDSVIEAMDSVMMVPTVVTGAVMPDACPTGPKQITVGGIVVTKNAIHPAMHSADICCSVMTTNFGDADPKEVLDAAHSITHFGPGGRKDFSELPKELEGRILGNSYLKDFLDLARFHMGTQGDGNHFLFVGKSKATGDTHMVTHHGSRGLGAALYKMGMKKAEFYRKELAPKVDPKNAWIPYDTKDGKEYWEALQIVREWTKLNHRYLHKATLRKINVKAKDCYWNEHNFVFKEKDLFYHAKGATPLKANFVPDNITGLRLIPLNMSQPILVVKGEATENNLGFAPHGAGRNTSRTAHKRKQTLTDQEVFDIETKGLDIRFYSKIVDTGELPSAYKNADQVRAQIEKYDLGEVVDEIMPYGCIMAGDWLQNAPWKIAKEKKKAAKLKAEKENS